MANESDVKVRVLGEDAASREIAKVDDSLKGFQNSFTELKSQLDIAKEGLQAFIGTFEKAFELGREGAIFQQTTASFDQLIAKTGASEELLNELRAASRGTVDDLTLMSSALTLSAGAGDDFARQLLNATPELMNIAKASNKLNPTLGDTAFLFESIATGIKRGSPLILDNLGITIKMEEAYSEYAETLGKAASELNSTEQKQAILNKVLEQGNVLIQQAGGNTESAVDDFDRLTASLENIGNEMKSRLVPGLSDAASALETLLMWNKRLQEATREHGEQVATTAGSYEEYIAEMERALKAQGLSVQVTDNGLRVYAAMGSGLRDVTEQYGIMTQGMYEAYLMANNLQGAYDGVAGGQARMNLSLEQVTAAQERMKEATEQLTEAQVEWNKEINKVALQAGVAAQLEEGWEKYRVKAQEVATENAKLRAEIEKLIAEGVDPASDEVTELTQKMRDNVLAQVEAAEATNKATREFIYQKAAAQMDEEAALKLAVAMGVLSQKDYDLTMQVSSMTKALDTNNDAQVEGTEVTTEYLQAMVLLADATEVALTANGDMITTTEQYIDTAKDAYTTTKEWAGAAEALSAGLSGRYTAAVEAYKDRVAQAAEENSGLALEMAELSAKGELTSEAFGRITEKMNENKVAAEEAADALRKSTAEMIYQAASAGLGTEDALVLARAMGLISEEDYNLMMQLQLLRKEFDSNSDGMIEASENAAEYTRRVIALYQSVDRLNQSLAASPFGGGGGAPGQTPVGYGMTDMGNGIYQYTAPGEQPVGGSAITINNVNNGVTLNNEAELQRILTPIVNYITGGR